MPEPIAITALALDAAIGWPHGVYRRLGHPVGLFARIITGCESRWNKPDFSNSRRRILGVACALILLAVTIGAGLVLEHLFRSFLGPLAWLAVAVLAWPALAQRSLYDHVRPIALALARNDLPAAREAVGMIVGRDTRELDQPGIARAAIESLAESFCDGIAAPLFWLIAGGLPGVWAYKAINTADSLIGHREERWRAFGWAAARTDDLLNLVPARIGGAVICMAGGGGWTTMWRDHARHASPNAGWTEAAMAGALGLRLAGPISYDGVVHEKPWISQGKTDTDAADVRRAIRVYVRSCLVLAGIATAIALGDW